MILTLVLKKAHFSGIVYIICSTHVLSQIYCSANKRKVFASQNKCMQHVHATCAQMLCGIHLATCSFLAGILFETVYNCGFDSNPERFCYKGSQTCYEGYGEAKVYGT